jgi:hypothetical protein
MVIKEAEPWLLWPDMVSYEINTGKISETFEGHTDFTMAINLKVLSTPLNKRTIFAKLPNYCGIDIETNNTPMLILKLLKNGEELYRYLTSETIVDRNFNLLIYRYNKKDRVVEVLVNENVAISYSLENNEELTVGFEPHIIFGSGNFPKNNFNLNYCSYETDFILISKSYKSYSEIIDIKNKQTIDESIVGLYDFKKYTDYKVYDLSENCNFIHKII